MCKGFSQKVREVQKRILAKKKDFSQKVREVAKRLLAKSARSCKKCYRKKSATAKIFEILFFDKNHFAKEIKLIGDKKFFFTQNLKI